MSVRLATEDSHRHKPSPRVCLNTATFSWARVQTKPRWVSSRAPCSSNMQVYQTSTSTEGRDWMRNSTYTLDPSMNDPVQRWNPCGCVLTRCSLAPAHTYTSLTDGDVTSWSEVSKTKADDSSKDNTQRLSSLPPPRTLKDLYQDQMIECRCVLEPSGCRNCLEDSLRPWDRAAFSRCLENLNRVPVAHQYRWFMPPPQKKNLDETLKEWR